MMVPRRHAVAETSSRISAGSAKGCQPLFFTLFAKDSDDSISPHHLVKEQQHPFLAAPSVGHVSVLSACMSPALL